MYNFTKFEVSMDWSKLTLRGDTRPLLELAAEKAFAIVKEFEDVSYSIDGDQITLKTAEWSRDGVPLLVLEEFADTIFTGLLPDMDKFPFITWSGWVKVGDTDLSPWPNPFTRKFTNLPNGMPLK